MRKFKLAFIVFFALLFSGCFIFRKKNRCDDCPNFHKSEINNHGKDTWGHKKNTVTGSPETTLSFPG